MKNIIVIILVLLTATVNAQSVFRNNNGDTLVEFSVGDTVTWVLDNCISAGYEQGIGSNATQAIALVNKIKVATTIGNCGWVVDKWDTTFVYTINNVNIGGRRMFTIVLPDLGTDSSVRYLSRIGYSTGKPIASSVVSHDSIVVFGTPTLPFNAKASITKDSVHISTKGIYGKDSVLNIAVQPGDSVLVKVITNNKFGKCADSLERWVGNPYVGDTIRFTETEVHEYKRILTDAQTVNIGLKQPTYVADTGSIYAVFYLDVLRPGTYKAQFNYGTKEDIYVDVVPSVLVIYAKPSTDISVANANGCFGDSAYIIAHADSVSWFTFDNKYLHSQKHFYTDSNGLYYAKVYNELGYEVTVPLKNLPNVAIAPEYWALIDTYTDQDTVGNPFSFQAYDLKGTYSYEWYFLDSLRDSGKSFSYSFIDTGVQEVKLKVMNVNYPHCGIKYDSVNVIVLAKSKSPGVGLAKLDLDHLKVFPNPTAKWVTIEIDKDFSYQVLDLNGKVLKSGKYIGTSILELSDLEAGVYFLTIVTENRSYSARIVKY